MTRLHLIGTTLLALASIPASAQPPDDRWYWMYAALSGGVYDHDPVAKVDSRFGRATVRISGSKVIIEFDEPAIPETHPIFNGRIAKNGAISGVLPDFFDGDAPGPGRLIGQYRRGSSPACWEEDIYLREPSPSRDAWILYREHGNCMAGGEDEPPMGR